MVWCDYRTNVRILHIAVGRPGRQVVLCKQFFVDTGKNPSIFLYANKSAISARRSVSLKIQLHEVYS